MSAETQEPAKTAQAASQSPYAHPALAHDVALLREQIEACERHRRKGKFDAASDEKA